MNETFYTRDQLDKVLTGWGVEGAKLPTKKTRLVIAFPPPAVLNVGTVTLAREKSTYGKKLYRVRLEQVNTFGDVESLEPMSRTFPNLNAGE